MWVDSEFLESNTQQPVYAKNLEELTEEPQDPAPADEESALEEVKYELYDVSLFFLTHVLPA